MKATSSRPLIGVAAPADNLPDDMLAKGLATLRDNGFEPVLAANLRESHGRMAGVDAMRAAGLMELSANDEIEHILLAAGGYGSGRVLPLIDWEKINPAQSWIGFSDTTAVLNARIAQTGVGGWHGPLLKQLQDGFIGPDRQTLLAILRGNAPKGYAGEILTDVKVMKAGKTRGRLIGGNLAVLRSLMGTPYMPMPEPGDILFVEDICETNFRLDRDLEQLAQGGWFEELGGLIFGRFSDIQEATSRPYGFTVHEIFERHAARVNGPVVMDFPAGHAGLNLPLPLGSTVVLEAGKIVSLTFEGAE